MSVKINGTTGIITPNIDSGSYNQGQLAGFRNKIINGAFLINQRGYVSGAATTAGQYTLDRWKVTGTGGVTFSSVANKTSITIPSGQTIQQVIEGLNLQSGDYVLSWEGTAQGRINSGSYGNSGQVISSITGGSNTTIEFSAGTVSNVQLEPGNIATPFEQRPYGIELALCQRYFEIFGGVVVNSALQNQGLYKDFYFSVRKRTIPTISNIVFGSGSGATFSLVDADRVYQETGHSISSNFLAWANAEL